mmetsp:Transcript_18413/g.38297  ORF Transcript_18413/g.38297 Transcript_18413/m.38297 type:complete len:166 (+) Transcript_18413:26-523(+)
MDHSFEGGVRTTQFWRWAVDREVRAQAAWRHRRLGHSGSAPNVLSPALPEMTEPVADHGAIFTSLHDVHRQQVQAQARAAVRLPPVQPGSPAKDSNPWGWQRGNQVPSDVESALTLATTAAMASVLSSAAPRARVPEGSCIGSTLSAGPECRRRTRSSRGMTPVT